MRKEKNWLWVKQGRLTIVGKLRERGRYGTKWLAGCSCDGRLVTIESAYLASGTSSCGCLQREAATTANTTHGDSKTRLYSRWTSWLRRARKPHSGVAVDLRWYQWERFKKDVGDVPPGVQLRRMDRSRPLGPDNCQLTKLRAA